MKKEKVLSLLVPTSKGGCVRTSWLEKLQPSCSKEESTKGIDIIQLLKYSFNHHLLNAYFVPGTVLMLEIYMFICTK